MTTATASPTINKHDDPGWYRVLVIWRGVVALLIAAALAGTLTQTGIVLNGPVRWTLVVALVGALVAAGLAIRGTLQRVHLGRSAGFTIDFLMAVVFGFLALNRMEMFTGLDAVGEAFNGSVGWILIIVLGWLISGFAERAGSSQQALRNVARWTAALGFAALALTMGLLPGIVEFVQRLVAVEVLPLAILAVVAAGFARVLWSDAATPFFGTTQSQTETMDGWVFVAPNILGFLVFFAGPLVISLFISFTDWDGLTDATFTGLSNYIDLFSDALFLKSLRNVLVFGLMAIPLAVIPALFLAALLNSKLPGMKAFRAIYFLPAIAGVVGVTLIWKQLFNSTVGYINFGILKVTEAVNAVLGTGFEAAQPQWISDANIALFSLVILFAWQVIGFNTVLFVAGMQGINQTLYEAAEIDGAGPWRKFRSITVPSLRPTTVFVVVQTTILALQLFNEPFILQAPGPPAGPGNATLSPVIYLYQNAFQQFQIGYGSAVAWALFILIFGITLLYFKRGGEDGVLST
jgi:ABC-type sugar transport system permease subunit